MVILTPLQLTGRRPVATCSHMLRQPRWSASWSRFANASSATMRPAISSRPTLSTRPSPWCGGGRGAAGGGGGRGRRGRGGGRGGGWRGGVGGGGWAGGRVYGFLRLIL